MFLLKIYVKINKIYVFFYKKIMTNFVSIPEQNKFKKQNLFIVAKMFWFTWIIFHFTIIYFFWLILDSILLVWLFLWFWNFVALLLDIPLWVIQKYFKPKNLLIFWNILMIITTIIFLKFIFFSTMGNLVPSFLNTSLDSSTISNISIFFNEGINWFLILLAATFYWVIKETFDITFLSYILGDSTPSEYAENLSKYNISFWIWALAWVILSWIILWFAIEVAIVIVFIIVIIFLLMILKIFDKNYTTLNFSKIKDLNITNIKWWVDKSKTYMIESVKKVDIKTILKTTKYVFLVPMEIKKEIDTEEIIKNTIDTFKSVFRVILGEPKSMVIIWSMSIMLFFGFWDTFVATFQIDFLNKIIHVNWSNAIISNTGSFITWYVLLWLLIIPIFLSQQFFIDKSKKFGVFSVISFWVLLSWFSIFFFWLSQNIVTIMFFWLLNSFWYAAAMPLAMATFSEKYNIEYAKKYNLKEISSNSSAAPLKILINLANVFWLITWWFLVAIMWFDKFFIFLWTCLLVILLVSFLNKDSIIKNDD